MRTTNRLLASLLAAAIATGCQTSSKPAMAEGECVGCQPILAPPEHPATAYRFEVQYWEMPLARAESLYRAADRDSSSIALMIDKDGLHARLHDLHASDGDVRPLAPSSCDAAAGARALVPRVVAGGDAGSWSAGVRLELGAEPTPGWSPHALDFACVWTSPQGERLATAAGKTPLAPERGVVVWCLPSKSLADAPEPRTARAVVALVRISPRH